MISAGYFCFQLIKKSFIFINFDLTTILKPSKQSNMKTKFNSPKLQLISILLIIFFQIHFSSLHAQVQVGQDIDGDAASDYSGSAISLTPDGKTIAIGAEQNDDAGADAGQTRVYTLNSSNVWTQVGQDIDGEDLGDWSGTSVAISDDGMTVIAGARYSNGGGGASGQTRVHRMMNGVWTQIGADINGEAAFDYAGYSVAISADGNTIAIGATHNDGSFMDAGHVRVLTFNGANWTPKGPDIDGEAASDNSGWSVSLSDDGNVIAVGAYKNQGNGNEAGQARVFEFDGTSWTQRGSDIDGGAGDRFGWDVSLSSDGNTLAVGGTHNTNAGGYQAGVTRVYEFTGGNWSQMGQDLIGESLVDWFGYSVEISGDASTVAVGAIRNDGSSNPDGGKVSVFTFDGSMWAQKGTDIDSENSGDWFGYSVALSDDGSIVAGGGLNNADAGSYAGHVRVFEFSLDCQAVDEQNIDICVFLAGDPNHPLAMEDCDNGGISNKEECDTGYSASESTDDCLAALASTNVDICAIINGDPSHPLATKDCDDGGMSNYDECTSSGDPKNGNDDCQDLALTLIVLPTSLAGPTPIGIAVTVQELNNRNTDGTPIRVRIPADPRFMVTWDPNLTSVALTPVDNSVWTYNNAGVFNEFIFQGTYTGTGILAFGFQSNYDPQNTDGTTTITATIVPFSGGECNVTNNGDAEQIVYFK